MMNKEEYEMNRDSSSEGDAQEKQFDMVGTNTSPVVPVKSVTAPRKRSTATRKQVAANGKTPCGPRVRGRSRAKRSLPRVRSSTA